MTPEQAALIRKAHDSLRAARVLAEQEQLYDVAVSRAYYAMFYVAEAFLLGEGLAFSKHSAVIAAFGQHFAKTGRVPQEFQRYLLDGEESRNVSDYDVRSDMTPEKANEQITHAAKFLELAEHLIGPVTPSAETQSH